MEGYLCCKFGEHAMSSRFLANLCSAIKVERFSIADGADADASCSRTDERFLESFYADNDVISLSLQYAHK